MVEDLEALAGVSATAQPAAAARWLGAAAAAREALGAPPPPGERPALKATARQAAACLAPGAFAAARAAGYAAPLEETVAQALTVLRTDC